MQWSGGRVAVEDRVAASTAVSGGVLRDSFFESISAVTLGLIQPRGEALFLGRLELLRFGPAEVETDQVIWAIEGGLLAAAPGGRFGIQSLDDGLVARVDGYQPRLPLAIYALTQLPVHHLVLRLQLLRARGRRPAPGVPAEPATRLAAGAIDVALCAGLAAVVGRKHRLTAFLGVAAGYHLACWSLSGRTIGGLVMRQRVVAVDGSRPSLGQALVRLLMMPMAVARLRGVHDEIAGTDVIAG